jgi:hypothetical protein
MWAEGSQIKTTKENKGTCPNHRMDPMDTIVEAMDGNFNAGYAITSFTVNLLPFFRSSKKVHAVDFSDRASYVLIIEENPVFCAMAWYLHALGYRVDESFKGVFSEMMQKFEELHDPLSVTADPQLETLMIAMDAWRPSVGNRTLKGTEARDKVLNFMYITYAMELDADFKVTL